MRYFEMQKWIRYAILLRLHKPVGMLLLLWPTLIALWVAGHGSPNPWVVCTFATGVLVMRSAGCVINDIVDRHFDGHVTRTKTRPLVLGNISPREASRAFSYLIMIALILVLQLNFRTIALSSIAFTLSVLYPFMKRHTHFPQVVLGAAFGWAIPMAFSAQLDAVPMEAWLLYLATLCWVIAYDTQYAMVDREDDVKIGIKSTAIFFGKGDRIIILIMHLLALIFFILAGQRCTLSIYYYIGIAVAFGIALYQFRLTRNRDRESCFKAFSNNNVLGACLFLGVIGGYYC